MSYVIGINRTGKDGNNYTYSGSSVLLDSLGEVLSSLKENEVGIVSAFLVKSEQDRIRKKLGFLTDKDSFIISK
jgi:predicted amidohydrolase